MKRRVRQPTDPQKRFWSKVHKSEGCWTWQGTLRPTGYGTVWVPHPWRNVRAHRYSWELHNGPIPDGLCVCHRCDNPSCVRPDHLFLGTHAENMADMSRKGRTNPPPAASHARGERNHAKLTEADVIEMRRQRKAGALLRELAERFGVCATTARAICIGKKWAHVRDEMEAA